MRRSGRMRSALIAAAVVVASAAVAAFGLLGGCGGGDGGGGTQQSFPRFAYVVNSESHTISIYTVDAPSGRLRHNGYVRNAGTNPWSVTVDPSGRFAYVANGGSNNVSAYEINASTGALTAVGTVGAGTNPRSIATTGVIR